MEKLRFSSIINAPRQKVWDTMLNDSTYRQWTEPFHPGSYYEGNWDTGSEIRFLAHEEDGTLSGMVARIKESRLYEFVSIQHLGEVKRGQEIPWDQEETGGQGIFENYTFRDVDGGTEVTVEIDTNEEFKQMFQGIWPKALEKLKVLSES